MNENRNRLFLGACFALIVTSVSFAVRSKCEEVFRVDYGLSPEEIGWAIGPAFWGFTAAMVIGGLIIDIVKTKTIIWTGFVLHLLGIITLIFADTKISFYLGNLFFGLGNGCVEASFNPMIATLFPNEKTKMLNRFHVWFPGGIVIGGLLAYLMMDLMGLSHQLYIGVMLIPLLIYGYLFIGQSIPETERVANKVSYSDMIKATGAPFMLLVATLVMFVLANFGQLPFVSACLNFFPEKFGFSPSSMYIVIVAVLLVAALAEGKLAWGAKLVFPLMFFMMLLTAATELVTTQWMNALFQNAGVNAMVLLALITAIMAVGRFFAGGLVHKFNPAGVLLISSILALIGLYMMSVASGPAFTIISAIVFAVGVCYFWPTMLGYVAEYVPESGALGMSIMGGAGMVSVAMFLPMLGGVMEKDGTQTALRFMGFFPLILIAGFLVLLFVYGRKQNTES
ncbi:MAG: MFS transporter [Planctomycetes bacterium]|nr:MFS transporter [Planctomycetota bacterium]